MDLLEIEQAHDFVDLQFFAVILWRPAQEAEIIAHRFGKIAAVDVSVEARPLIALTHLGAILV